MNDINDPSWVPEIPDGLEPLTPNPGGPGDAAELVGRHRELDSLMQAVSIGYGAHVTGERRMGKTWLIKKLQSDLTDTITAIYISAETASLDIFEKRLLDALRAHRLIGRQIGNWEATVGGKAKLALGPFGLKLTASLTKPATPTPEPLDVLALLGQHHVVLIIDEITQLCANLGPKGAAEFLHSLRAQRQSGGPALVISGSIGLHHALRDLTPINDLSPVEVGPLTTEYAVELAARLLMGIGADPVPQLVAGIVRQTGCIPFYIHSVIK